MAKLLTSYKDKWIVFIGAGLLVFLINIDTTIVNLALPIMGHQFMMPLSQLKWVINIYLISGASFFLLSGRLSELLGHRLIFLIGTVLFCVGSLIAGLAENWFVLLSARTIQGIGFAFTLSQALTLISEKFPLEQQGFAVGLSIIITGVGQAVGPTAGGFILAMLNWHWIFLINIPFCILSFAIVLIYCEKSNTKSTLAAVDLFNNTLFIAALICFMVAISIFDLTHYILSLELLILCLVFLVIFYYQNKKSPYPLFDFTLFKIPAYNVSLFIRFVFVLIWVALLFSFPLYLENIALYTPLDAGFILLAMTILMVISAPIAGKWSDRVGLRLPLRIGLICCLISLIMLSIPVIRSNIILLLLSLLPFGLSSGILIPLTIVAIVSNVPLERKGTALGLLFTLTFVGGSMGTSLMSICLANLSWYHFQKLYTAAQLQIPHALLDHDLKSIVNGVISVAKINTDLGLSTIQMNQWVSLIQQSFGFAFSVALVFFAIAILCLLVLTRYFK